VPVKLPLNVVELLSAVVKVPELKFTVPLPAKEPMVSLKVLVPSVNAKVAPPATVTSLVLGTVLVAPTIKVPALMVVELL